VTTEARIAPPPAEIAADPARRALYFQSIRDTQHTHAGQRIFVAEGCGERRTYICDYGSTGDGGYYCERAAP
jgi:hypothetical protein